MISWDKIENLKIPVGVFKNVCSQSPIWFFSGKDHFLETEGVNQSVGEGTIKKKEHQEMPRIYKNLDFI